VNTLRCTSRALAKNMTMYEDFSADTCADAAEAVEDELPTPHRVAHEMSALQASLLVVERGADREEAHLLCRTYLGRLEPQTVEERVIEGALRRILKHSVLCPAVEPNRLVKWESYVAEVVALAWLAWAAGDHEHAFAAVRRLRSKQKRKETFSGRTGALHLMTLSWWSQAVLLLGKGDLAQARRYFKRAIEMGSQFGTDSHPMISWAYAASFFHDE
jgi:hypothetical protein